MLSPLTVWFAVAMWAVHRYAVRGLDSREARWVTWMLVVGVGLRVAAVAWLFAHTNHAQTPYSVFFGDEEFYLRRSVWLRNVALGIPIHSADLIYAFDDSGWTSHLYVLAFVQVLVGPAPYGLHLVDMLFYVLATCMLFRLVRPAFGRAPAMLVLGLMLFLPSLFAWSISVLKEPLYLLMTVSCITLTIKVARSRRWWTRIAALAGAVAIVAAIGTVRDAGTVLTGAGVVLGVGVAWMIRRPKVLVAVAVALPIVVGAALRDPGRQIQAYLLVNRAVKQHWGHVSTPGWVYTILDEYYYVDIGRVSDLRFDDQAKFIVRSFERYLTVPLPWEAQSTAALAYLPEQIVWYCIVALLPVGLLYSWRRDPLLASIFLSVGVVAATAIALLNGNVGTLVRLRVLSIPYFACLSMVGLCELLARAPRTNESGLFEKAEPIWP